MIQTKPILAYFSPLRPAKTGIAAYSSRVLEVLATHYSIECFYDEPTPDPELLPEDTRFYHYQTFPEHYSSKKYEQVLYQLGNSSFHRYISYCAKYFPGILDIHDVNIHHLMAHNRSIDPEDTTYLDQMREQYGEQGVKLAEMSKIGVFHDSQCFLFPLGKKLFEKSLGIIVHNKYSEEVIGAELPDHPLALIPPPIEPGQHANDFEQRKMKHKLGIDEHTFLICSFGEVLRKKGCYRIVDAFREIKKSSQKVTFVFVGQNSEGPSFQQQLESFQSDAISITDYVDDTTYNMYLKACDAGINLRFPSVGETSQTLLELMANAKPVVVSNYHYGAELPSEVVYKISTDEESQVMELVTCLNRILEEPGESAAKGSAAREYIVANHAHSEVEKKFIHFLQSVVPGQTANQIKSASDKYTALLEKTYYSNLTRTLKSIGWTKADIEELKTRIPLDLLKINN